MSGEKARNLKYFSYKTVALLFQTPNMLGTYLESTDMLEYVRQFFIWIIIGFSNLPTFPGFSECSNGSLLSVRYLIIITFLVSLQFSVENYPIVGFRLNTFLFPHSKVLKRITFTSKWLTAIHLNNCYMIFRVSLLRRVCLCINFVSMYLHLIGWIYSLICNILVLLSRITLIVENPHDGSFFVNHFYY